MKPQIKYFCFLMSMILLFSCKEFYDDDFKNNDDTNIQSEQDGQSETLVVNWMALDSRFSIDDIRLEIGDEDKTVTFLFELKNLPSNILYFYYGFLSQSDDCSNYLSEVPMTELTTRHLQYKEILSYETLALDLFNAGATSNRDDVSLLGKKIIIRVRPRGETYNSYNLYCGIITK